MLRRSARGLEAIVQVSSARSNWGRGAARHRAVRRPADDAGDPDVRARAYHVAAVGAPILAARHVDALNHDLAPLKLFVAHRAGGPAPRTRTRDDILRAAHGFVIAAAKPAAAPAVNAPVDVLTQGRE
jgi:hypothetical protein